MLARRPFLGAGLGAAASLLGLPTPQTERGSSHHGLRVALESYAASRTGTVGLALYDRRSRVTWSWRDHTTESFSTVKLLILVALLHRAEAQRTRLTKPQLDHAWEMIVTSDNPSTDRLLASVDSADVHALARRLGMTRTVIQAPQALWWGFTPTAPGDLLRLMNAVVYGTEVIDPGHRAYCRHLMSNVTPRQRWGAFGGHLPNGVRSLGKNGWGPMGDGYRLNSVGWVSGNGRDYTLAMTGRSPAGYWYGRETMDRVSLIVHDALAAPLEA